ncbi:MAG TPA: hypothetical protein VK773_12550 [Acidimicrobiales bacterium]|nr:hypothetical protein [Acidimicrobiales bacterium]
MTDTEAATGSAGSEPSTQDFQEIFSPADPLDVLWVKAYQGEVLGEALFDLIADQVDDDDHKAKMRVLAKLERRTKEAVAPALERAGLPTEPDPESLKTAEALSGAAATPWKDLLATFEPITSQFCAMYRRIGELDPAERETSDLLVAHELALRDFARAEIAGETATSLDRIEALAHMQ